MDSKKILASALSAGIMLSGTGILQSIANAQATGSAYNVKDQSNQSKKNILETVGLSVLGLVGVGALAGTMVYLYKEYSKQPDVTPASTPNPTGVTPASSPASHSERYVVVGVGQSVDMSTFLTYLGGKQLGDSIKQGDLNGKVGYMRFVPKYTDTITDIHAEGVLSEISADELKQHIIKVVNGRNNAIVKGWLIFDAKQQKWVEIDPKMAATAKIGAPIPNASAASTPAPAGTTSVVPTVLPPADEAYKHCHAGEKFTSAVVIKREDANRYGALLRTDDKIPLWTTDVGSDKQLIDIAIGGYVKGDWCEPHEKGDGKISLKEWSDNQTNRFVRLSARTQVKIFVQVGDSWKKNISLDQYLNNPNVTMSSAPAAPAPAAPAPAAPAPAPAPVAPLLGKDLGNGIFEYSSVIMPEDISTSSDETRNWSGGACYNDLQKMQYQRMSRTDGGTTVSSGPYIHAFGIENLECWCADQVNERIIREHKSLDRKCLLYTAALSGSQNAPGTALNGDLMFMGGKPTGTRATAASCIEQLKNNGCSNIAVLDAANNLRPGGNPAGASTLEETLLGLSTLSCSLLSKDAYHYYKLGHEQGAFDPNRCLVVDNVKFYPSAWLMETGTPRCAIDPTYVDPHTKLNTGDLHTVKVIAAAANNLKGKTVDRETYYNEIYNMYKQIYLVCRDQQIDGLVWAGIGNGVFKPAGFIDGGSKKDVDSVWSDAAENARKDWADPNLKWVKLPYDGLRDPEKTKTYYQTVSGVATKCNIPITTGLSESKTVLAGKGILVP